METSCQHKIEEIVATRGTVVIGCVCGWVHSEPSSVDAEIARARCREAMREHKRDMSK